MTSAGGALAVPIAPLPVTALANAGSVIALPSLLAAELGLQPGELIKGRVVMRDGVMRLLLDGAAGQILKLPANSDATPGAVWQLKAILTTQGWQLLRAAAEALSPLAGFKPRPASLAPQLLSIAGGSLRTATPAPALWPQPLDVEWVAAALQTRPQTRLRALPAMDAAVAAPSSLALAPRASPGDAHAAPPATASAPATATTPATTNAPATTNTPTTTNTPATPNTPVTPTQRAMPAQTGVDTGASAPATSSVPSHASANTPVGAGQAAPERSLAAPQQTTQMTATNTPLRADFTPANMATILTNEVTRQGLAHVLGIDQTNPALRPTLLTADTTALRLAEPQARELGLRDGQVVKGLVEANGESLKLVLNGLAFELPAASSLARGDSPLFRAVQSPGGWLLKPLPIPNGLSAAPGLAPGTVSTMTAMLLRPLEATGWMQLLSDSGLAKALAKTPEFFAWRKSRPSMARLGAAELREAVAGSGLFAESALTQGRAPAAHDLKLALQSLLKATAGDPLLNEPVDRALKDIESSQLQAVQAQSQRELLLNLVIPFADANPVRLSFSRPAPSREEPDPPFTVSVHTRNEHLGEVWLKTAVSGQNKIDMTMWAAQPEVATAAHQNAHALAHELENAGLEMNSFVIYNGPRPNTPQDTAPPGSIVNVAA